MMLWLKRKRVVMVCYVANRDFVGSKYKYSIVIYGREMKIEDHKVYEVGNP